MVGEVFIDLPDNQRREMVALWNEENAAETTEAQIVKAADKLQLLSKTFEEMKAGNTYFEDIYKSQLSLLKKLSFPWWKKIAGEVLSGAEKQV